MAQPAPQPVTGKRKRNSAEAATADVTTVHVTVGSYERVLHGFAASLDTSKDPKIGSDVTFSDLFLLNAHASSIRCLALSPPSHNKRILATGSSDERINLYQISTVKPVAQDKARKMSKTAQGSTQLLSAPLLSAHPAQRNRELGNLLHHSSTVTTLAFPSYSKLLTASLDNTLCILRTRDWTHLVTMRAPAPKSRGRPDGDTAGPGETPAGFADVAVHPSQRLAISVGQGERCMRLWNLVGGKKAGVLVFDRRLLEMVGEPRKSIRAGEGKRVVWRSDGQEFAVSFEKGVAIFSLDCRPKAVIVLGARNKVGQIRYLPRPKDDQTAESCPLDASNVMAVSTESGDLLFYSGTSGTTASAKDDGKDMDSVETLRLLGKVSSPSTSGPRIRIKDFQVLSIPRLPHAYYVITGSSDGAVRFWKIDIPLLVSRLQSQASGPDSTATTLPSIGQPMGTYETGKRITCMAAFVMDSPEETSDGPRATIDHVGEAPGSSSDGEDEHDIASEGESSGDEALKGQNESDGEKGDEFGGFDE